MEKNLKKDTDYIQNQNWDYIKNLYNVKKTNTPNKNTNKGYEQVSHRRGNPVDTKYEMINTFTCNQGNKNYSKIPIHT